MIFARIARWVGRLTAVGLTVSAVVVFGETRSRPAVSPASDQRLIERDVDSLSHRLTVLEGLELGTRVKLLEANVGSAKESADEMRKLIFLIIGGVAVQLVVATMQRKGRREG